ncbi:Vacuolar protein-sorting-associated protein 37 homolog 2-like protein [Drosera capensis]
MFRNSQQEEPPSRPDDAAVQSWYSPSAVNTSSSSRPSTPGGNSSSSYSMSRPSERAHSLLVKEELWKETLQLARENLEKETQITELRNQCRVIRTSELAAAQERLNELQQQKEELLKRYSPASLLQKLQEAMNEIDEESETLHKQYLNKEIELGAFIQKYKKLRTTYHRRAFTHLAAKTSPMAPLRMTLLYTWIPLLRALVFCSFRFITVFFFLNKQ